MQGRNGDRDIENSPVDKCVGKEEEGEMKRENSMEAYTLPYDLAIPLLGIYP